MYSRLLQNHVLANITFVLVVVIGALTYNMLPRQQDPTINFNWIQITTLLPGASAIDVEKRITDPLEDVVRKVSDIRFVSSTSREGVSSILVRFEDISERIFDKRVNDLRREIQNAQDKLPDDATDPDVFEITTDNAYPTATVLITGPAADENLRYQAELATKEIERIKGVDRVVTTALQDPELQVFFEPHKLHQLGVRPTDLADSVSAFFQDTPAGNQQVGAQQWLVRLSGTNSDPEYLAQIPILGTAGEVPLGEIAQVQRGREKPDRLVSFGGRPAVMLAITKKPDANTLELVERINQYVNDRNQSSVITGVRLVLVDDQTEVTRNAIEVMQTNALLGLGLVLLVAWAFLGFRIAILVSIGIPFILLGTFWLLGGIGQTLNVMVLLGVVISLGMLVDDAVVVVEAIYYRLNHGAHRLQAAIEGVREVVAPVTASVLTTIAAFLPLMLMPGILGKFMMVVPLVVTVALCLSLLEAYWMLPSHVLSFKAGIRKESKAHQFRKRTTHRIQIRYTQLLLKLMRYPKTALFGTLLAFILSIAAVFSGHLKVDFFASDPLRLFYVSVEMPPGSPIENTLEATLRVENEIRRHLDPQETRAIVSYAGQMFTQTEPLFGDHRGQIMVSLQPGGEEFRHVDEVIDTMRPDVIGVPGPVSVTFVRLTGGPPTAKPISVKVRGDNYAELLAASAALKAAMAEMPAISDISDDASKGSNEFDLRFNLGAIQESGLNPQTVARSLRLLVDGEIVASMQHEGEELEVRVRANPMLLEDIHALLSNTIALPGGGEMPLRELVHAHATTSIGNIRHYNFRRTITVEADLDKTQLDTLTANQQIMKRWQEVGRQFPNIDLDFTGELDDIQESMDAIGILFLFGIGLMYLILGTQFKSYFQPLLILSTVPMAFTGVVLGLLITQNPLSLYTMYGVVALAGIAVNAAIVLISAANDRLASGMSLLHATVYAARRRVIPILITSLTTIAGLSSLALGLGGKSLLWGPVATAIVCGLAVSSVLTLFAIPLLYRMSMGRASRRLNLNANPTTTNG